MASTKIRDLNSSICKREAELATLNSKIEKMGGRLTKLPWANTRKSLTSEKATKQKKPSTGKKKKKKKTVQKPWKYSPPAESWKYTIVYKKNSND